MAVTNREKMMELSERNYHEDLKDLTPLERTWLFDLEMHAQSLSNDELEVWLDQKWF